MGLRRGTVPSFVIKELHEGVLPFRNITSCLHGWKRECAAPVEQAENVRMLARCQETRAGTNP